MTKKALATLTAALAVPGAVLALCITGEPASAAALLGAGLASCVITLGPLAWRLAR